MRLSEPEPEPEQEAVPEGVPPPASGRSSPPPVSDEVAAQAAAAAAAAASRRQPAPPLTHDSPKATATPPARLGSEDGFEEGEPQRSPESAARSTAGRPPAARPARTAAGPPSPPNEAPSSVATGGVSALEGALQRQIVAGERREEVMKKQHHVAMLGQGARYASELARRDSEIGSLQEAVESLQQQHERKDVEILRLRKRGQRQERQERQLAAKSAAGGSSADAAESLGVTRSSAADRTAAGGGGGGGDAARRRRERRSSCYGYWLLTFGVLLTAHCAVLLAVPGGAATVHAAVIQTSDSLANATLREVLVEVGDGLAFRAMDVACSVGGVLVLGVAWRRKAALAPQWKRD